MCNDFIQTLMSAPLQLGVQDASVFCQMGQKGYTAAIKVSQHFFISLRKKKEIKILRFYRR